MNHDLVSLYKQLLFARALEQTLGRVPGYHAAIGEEAVVVGAFGGLRRDDYIAPHYRGALVAAHLRGADLRRLVAGVLGKSTSYNKGRFRGDICMPLEFNVVGMFSGLLGSPVGLATGAALACRQRMSDAVVVATFGDGTSNLGLIHESMNLAACLKLPIVFVCQNNQYAMAMSAGDAMKCASYAERAAAYGIPGLQVDGNDIIAVREGVARAVDRARGKAGPSLVEALTYRVAGHRVGDETSYQAKADMEHWLGRDPIKVLERRMSHAGHDIEGLSERIAAEAQVRIDHAYALASHDPDPTPEPWSLDQVFAPSVAEKR